MKQDRIHSALANWLDASQLLGKRETQEDAFRVAFVGAEGSSNRQILMVLCDGMGGHDRGEVASALVADSFVSAFRPHGQTVQAALRQATLHANEQLAETTAMLPQGTSMGCTLLAVLLTENSIHWVSVGDSLLYIVRGDTLLQLNADHSMRTTLNDLVDVGRMTQQEADADPRASQLLSAIVGESIPKIDLPDNPVPLEENDILLLASDGIATVSKEDVKGTCQSQNNNARDIVDSLLTQISEADIDNQDNVTIICHTVDSVIPLLSTIRSMEAPTMRVSAARKSRSSVGESTDKSKPDSATGLPS